VSIQPDPINVTINVESTEFGKVFSATTIDVVVDVLAPTIITSSIIIPSIVDVVAAVLAPTPVVSIQPDPINVINTVQDVSKAFYATTLDITVDVLNVIPVVSVPATVDAQTAVLAPNPSITIIPDPINVTANVEATGFGKVVHVNTLDVTVALTTTIIHVAVSEGLTIQASLLSPTPQVSIQPLVFNVLTTLDNPNITLDYSPGSLTVTGDVLPPLPLVTIIPDPLDVLARVRYDSTIRPDTLDVSLGLPPLIPHIIWYPNPLDVLTHVEPPTVNMFEGKSEWYFKMITYGGF
jgi:hypothetical protein